MSMPTSASSVNKTPKKLFLKKSKKILKNAKNYAAFKTVEKVAKKFMNKKLSTKMFMFIKLVSVPYNFFVYAFFLQLFQPF